MKNQARILVFDKFTLQNLADTSGGMQTSRVYFLYITSEVNSTMRSLPADVLWGSFVTHSFLSYGRLLNTADIYVLDCLNKPDLKKDKKKKKKRKTKLYFL